MLSFLKTGLGRKLFTAFLVISQAVFLLSPINLVKAQYTGDPTVEFINLPSSPLSETVTIEVQISFEVDNVYLYWPTSNMDSQIMSYQASTSSCVYSWDTTTFVNGDYVLQARAMYNSAVYHSDQNAVTVENNTSEPQDIDITIASPLNNTTVSGAVNIQVQVSVDSALVDIDIYDSGNQLMQSDIPVNIQGSTHTANWDSTAVSNGTYRIDVSVNKSGYEPANAFVFVDVNNNTESSCTVTCNTDPGCCASLTNGHIITGDCCGNGSCYECNTGYSWDGSSCILTCVPDGCNSNCPAGCTVVDDPDCGCQNNNNCCGVGCDNTSDNDCPADSTDDADTTDDNISDSMEPYIKFNASPNFISKSITLSAQTNIKSANVTFQITGPKNQSFSAKQASYNEYYFSWEAINFSYGLYQIKVIAVKDDLSANDVINIEYSEENFDVTDPDNEITAPEPIKINFTEEFSSPVAGTKKIFVSLNKEIEKIEFSIEGPSIKKYLAIRESDNKHFYFFWPTNEFINGYYKITAFAIQAGAIKAEKSVNIKVENKSNDYNNLSDKEIEIPEDKADSENAINSESEAEAEKTEKQKMTEIDKITEDKIQILPECVEQKILTPEECKKFMALPSECRLKGIKHKEECDKFISLPRDCRDKGLSPERCREYMEIKSECRQAGITDYQECKKYLFKQALSQECIRAGISTQEECRKFIFRQNLPKECQQAGVISREECDKIISANKTMHPECRQAGILNENACKKFMFKKYGDKKIEINNLPLECRKAEVKTAHECEKILNEIYLPKECQEQGIAGQKQCEFYLRQKYLTPECLEAGIASERGCNDFMFKKYSPGQCLEAGIENEQECRDFIFNKYAPKITCEGIDGWECKSAIKERHLGGIVFKQVKFREIEEIIKEKTDKTVKAEELANIFAAAKNIIPVKDKKVNLRVVAAKVGLVLNNNDNLIQTAPAALMIDTDGDGLPDDMEKRFGTDPEKSDTDGDGYSDGEEVKNNYNPLGPGKLQEAVSLIGEAILKNKILGQPKTEGTVADDYTVTKIANIKEEEEKAEQGYVFSGQAEPNSTVTLYIYSDLPIVATVKVDEFGNWQYKFTQSLIEGEHEIYIALNDNTGRVIKKSNPLNFFIKEAKAVSVQDFVAVASLGTDSKSESMIKYYVMTAVLIVVAGVLFFVIFIINRRRAIKF